LVSINNVALGFHMCQPEIPVILTVPPLVPSG
jgi:hypothetical protein